MWAIEWGQGNIYFINVEPHEVGDHCAFDLDASREARRCI